MEIFKVDSLEDLDNVKNYLGKDFIVDLENCDLDERKRVIDFFLGLTYLKGEVKKQDLDHIIVTGT